MQLAQHRALMCFGPMVVGVMLAGCATVVPSFDVPRDAVTGSPTVAVIVDRVTCELGNLVAPGAPNAPELLTGQYEVALQLDLTVTDTGGLAPSFTYLDPPFSFGANAKLEQSREQYFSQKLFYSLIDLKDEVAERDRRIQAGARGPRLTDCPSGAETNLAGELGIAQTVDMALGSNYLKVAAKAGDKGAFGGSVNFTVTKNLNGVGPTWTLTRFKGPGGLGSVSEVNIDKLTFAFAVAEHPLNAAQLEKRRSELLADTKPPAPPRNSPADQLLQQLQINQINTELTNIRALQ